MERLHRATLSGIPGQGLLTKQISASGDAKLVGFWKADGETARREHAYERLHARYLGRERVCYCGEVVDETGPHREGLEVVITRWPAPERADALGLQASDLPARGEPPVEVVGSADKPQMRKRC